MSSKSSIEWTDATWNPITGCTKISEGCKNCYAERIAKRFWKGRPFNQIICHADRLDLPTHWRKPRRIFVCSISDLFHPDVPDEFIWNVFDEISHNRRHTYMILTKRPQRMKNWFDKYSERFWNYHGIWLGVTAENQKMADQRIPILLEIPAAVRFVSVEPMLEQVDLYQYLGGNREIKSPHRYNGGLDWVICGCESGSGARPFDWRWAQNMKNQCVNADVPFFYKQGRYDGKIIKLPELDGQQWLEYPARRTNVHRS